ncbi:MAG: bifunctional glutamate N-acetyltransferase/amino-acid acetyltransferase ArgJ [Lachnospiraceae bacterium]|nr:bifunctional glutamate N-acetyltransferase/amino-acid acetyltransferase ArgJ [Lachnospiraceae bacterium]
MSINVIEGGVTAAKGFRASCTAAGIKYQGRTDMAMVYSEAPCTSAGVYTSNVVKAAPVIWDKEVTKGNVPVQAIVVNAGVANACTGKQGLDYCEQTAEAVSKALNVDKKGVIIGSTGVIGRQLPIDRIVAGVDVLAKSLESGVEAGAKASKAIMTTDTVNKEVAVTFTVGGKTVTMGGMAKGSGMIHPNMCTMLAYVTTDCAISKELLQEALSEDVEETFNMISVDGDTSTNDTLVVLANGLAGNEIIDKKGADYDTFKEALHYINEYLAKHMAADGEGATTLLEVKVVGAGTKAQAKKIAKSVICSSLTKAAIYGRDSNWGRIICAMGYSGAGFDPDKVSIWYEADGKKMLIVENGMDAGYSEEEATELLKNESVTVIADLHEGSECATAWGCDLTYDYVKINADYRS